MTAEELLEAMAEDMARGNVRASSAFGGDRHKGMRLQRPGYQVTRGPKLQPHIMDSREGRFAVALADHPDWAIDRLERGPTPISKGWRESL